MIESFQKKKKKKNGPYELCDQCRPRLVCVSAEIYWAESILHVEYSLHNLSEKMYAHADLELQWLLLLFGETRVISV